MNSVCDGKIAFANTLRGLAALSVLFAHYYSVFWGDANVIAQLSNSPPIHFSPHPTAVSFVMQSLAFLNLNLAAFGVALFFLISGFVIPFSFDKFNRGGFFIARFFRIVPTYVVGFGITVLAVYLSGKYFGKPFPFSAQDIWRHTIPGLRDWFFGRHIDYVVWTLEIEVKFYIVCGVFFWMLKKGDVKIFLIPILAALIAIYFAPNADHFLNKRGAYKDVYLFAVAAQYLVFMFIGVALNFSYRRLIRTETALFLTVLLFALFALSTAKCFPTAFNTVWSYGFAFLIFLTAMVKPTLFRSNRISNFFADISYPMYIIHGVAGYVLIRIFLDQGMLPWAAVLITMGVVFGLAYFLHQFVEMPTQRVGKKIARRAVKEESLPRANALQTPASTSSK